MKIRDTRTKKEFTVPDGTLIPYFFEVVGENKKTDEASADTAKETEKTDETAKKSEDKKTDK